MLSSQPNQSNILIVDDLPEELRLLSQILSHKGYVVHTASNGQLALQLIHANPPDLILLDIFMPGMSGYEVCQQLKADPSTQAIPVLFLTSLTDTASKIEGFEVGGVDYIIKPFQAEELLVRIRTHLMIRKLQQQLQEESDRFRGLSDAAFEGILIYQEDRIIDVNSMVATLSGYDRTELIGMEVIDLLGWNSRQELMKIGQLELLQAYEVQGLKRDGTMVRVEIQARPIVWQGNPARVVAIRDITHQRTLESENRNLIATLDTRDRFGELVGKSPVMKKMYQRLNSAAASDDTVIIYGETGTGKELAARMIFELSEHHTKTFVPVNCGAIQEHLFESQFFGYRKGAFTGADRDTLGYFDHAQGGTLFLDEVGELSLLMQAKLLRVLNDYTYTPVGSTTIRTADVRIIAATNQPLRDMVRTGKIREDFFHRLHVIALEMPPLRQHKEDIPLLITHFLTQSALPNHPPPTIPVEIVERFYAYDWPGNIRELYNELRRYLTTGEIELQPNLATNPFSRLTTEMIPAHQTFDEAITMVEKRLIANALTQTGGNKAKTATLLHIPLRTLHRKIKVYQL
jgi:PAS domain S-box-containing protein